ncbi:hypothetical protein HDU97_001067 [Phlyctochytrium planicorne]|nr:hypothetical protein HDU97_001067 [Phlyctochytrium planicorne]
MSSSGDLQDAQQPPQVQLTPTEANKDVDEAARAANARTKANHIRRAVLLMVLINIILPIVIYSVLNTRLGQTLALALSGIPPALDAIWNLIKSRRLEPIATLVIVSIIISIIVAVLTQDNRALLAKESLTTVCLGVGFLVSVGMKYNFIWLYNRQYAGPDEAVQAALEAQYQNPGVKKFTNKLCILWGVGLLIEAALRIVLIYTVDINIMVYVSPIILAVFMIGLVLITIAMVRRATARYKAMQEKKVIEESA